MRRDKGIKMESGYAVESDHRPMAMPNKKLGFFKRWLRNQVKNAWDQEREEMNSIKLAKAGLQIGPSTRQIDSDKGIRFQVYKANGGFVVETGFYDRVKDRHLNSLHIITDDKDLGQEIGKIITMESLKQ